MKTTITFLVLILSITSILSQVNVGKKKGFETFNSSPHSKKFLNELKNSRTVFVIPEKLKTDEIKPVFEDLWTFNEVIYVEEHEFVENTDKFISEDHMIIKLVDKVYEKKKDFKTVGILINFKLWAYKIENVKKNSKGELKYKTRTISEIYFTPTIRTRQELVHGNLLFVKNKKVDDNIEEYGEQRGFYNFDVGYVKNSLQELNTYLNNGENLIIRDGIVKKEKLRSLSNKTLYVPDWILLKYNAFKGSYGKDRTSDELFAKYNHQYEIATADEINEKILQKDDFYYLMHTQYNARRATSIIHSRTGEIIFMEESGGFNIKDDELKKISKMIGKANTSNSGIGKSK